MNIFPDTTGASALGFLKLAEDYNEASYDDSFEEEKEEQNINLGAMRELIRNNAALALQDPWVIDGLKKEIIKQTKRIAYGTFPIPKTTNAIMSPDPIGYFNALKFDENLALEEPPKTPEKIAPALF